MFILTVNCEVLYHNLPFRAYPCNNRCLLNFVQIIYHSCWRNSTHNHQFMWQILTSSDKKDNLTLLMSKQETQPLLTNRATCL